MTTKKMYKYIGYNGSVTTPVLLGGIDHLEMIELRAAAEHYLTDGNKKVIAVVVAVSEAANWIEVKGTVE